MTRFLMITDTHLGASPMGFYQQTPYPERFDALVEALGLWIDRCGPVDCVLHAGDLLDVTTPELIAHASESLARLGVPVHLALGNHDVTELDALAMWEQGASHLIGGGGSGGDFTIGFGDLQIHILATQWCETPHYWEEDLDPHLTDEQWGWLGAAIEAAPSARHIVMTHSQVLPVGVDQTGLDYPLHDSTDAYKASFSAFLARYPQVLAVLGGHSHLNSCIRGDGVHYISGSSLVESPFEFKCFEFDGGKLSMTTESLLDFAPDLAGPADYDSTKPYVQGRPQDRQF
jgi:3',5'-cyclic AMP phosphodiesterase CpdA